MSQNIVEAGAVPVLSGVTFQPTNNQCCGRVIEKLMGKAILGLGIAQIVIGLLCIIFQCISIHNYFFAFVIGHGIWAGILFIIAGSFGIFAGVSKRSGSVVTCMVMSIISAAASVPMFSFASIGWAIVHHYDYGLEMVTHVCMVLLGVTEGVIAIITASLCCHGVCCCGYTGAVYGQGVQVPGPGMQMVVIQGNPEIQQTVPVNGAYMITPQGQPVQVPFNQSGAGAPPQYKSKEDISNGNHSKVQPEP